MPPIKTTLKTPSFIRFNELLYISKLKFKRILGQMDYEEKVPNLKTILEVYVRFLLLEYPK